MTVSPSRPQDGNRRPSPQLRDAKRSLKARNSALPPILFQLPNLVPGDGESADQETPAAQKSPTTPAIEQITTEQSETASTAVEPCEGASRDDGPRITRIDSSEAEVSFLERVGTHAVVFGMLGLMIVGALYIARNVNLPKKERQVTETSVPNELEPNAFELSQQEQGVQESGAQESGPSGQEYRGQEFAPVFASTNLNQQSNVGIAPPLPSHPYHSPSNPIVEPEVVLDLTEPTVNIATPQLPVAAPLLNNQHQINTGMPAPAAPEFPNDTIVSVPAANNPLVSEAKLQIAERSQKLAEQIARTEEAIQNALPDAPNKPLEEFADSVKQKIDAVIDQPKAVPENPTVVELKAEPNEVESVVKIPSNDKLDQELNAALESMKKIEPLKVNAASVATIEPKTEAANVISEPTSVAKAVQSAIEKTVSTPQVTPPQVPSPQSTLAENSAGGFASPQYIRAQTNTPAEPNTAIAEILKPTASPANGFVTNPLANNDPMNFSDGSMIPAQPVSSADAFTPSPTTLNNRQSRTPHAVANWLKYLPSSSTRR